MTEEDKYVSVTVTSYGYFETAAARQLANDFKFENWKAEFDKRQAYYKTPEGQAELKREQEERDARWKREEKFRKRWQWLYNWLRSKGCECDCGEYY